MKQGVALAKQLEVLRESVREFGETVEREKAKSSFVEKIVPLIGVLLSVALGLFVLKAMFSNLSDFLR